MSFSLIFVRHKTHIMDLASPCGSFYFLFLTLQIVMISLLGHLDLPEHWRVNRAVGSQKNAERS